MQVEILIQNVSAQCIPNLVAAKTLRAGKIIWVSTPEYGDVLARLCASARQYTSEQESWIVDARDAEALHTQLSSQFGRLHASGKVVYHLTGGTKSMALQGLFNLGLFRRNGHADVIGMVMDPSSQYFDIIYPAPVNNALACDSLRLDEMLAVHGNALDERHAHESLSVCFKQRALWESLRLQAQALRRVWNVNDMRALHARPTHDQWRHFRCIRALPEPLKHVLALLADEGHLSELSFPANDQVRYKQRRRDILKLITGGWLECWLGAVLYEGELTWNGAQISARVREQQGGSQEFDFLGATDRNRLVYWSCKTDGRLSNDKLFEVDALRDGIAGSDFHVAGLLHTSCITDVMQAKAGRMHIHTVCVHDADAAERVVSISGR